ASRQIQLLDGQIVSEINAGLNPHVEINEKSLQGVA
ncbi:MAG TPA: ABC transporter ATP-binding protein, partial [Colwellia sp.]|nr:ABC transporter ATP-binding protein [Colwellia sp.]